MSKKTNEVLIMFLKFYGVMAVCFIAYCYLLERFGLPFIRWVYQHFR